MRPLGEHKTYKYFYILEANIIKTTETKEKVRKEYPRITKKTLRNKTM